MANYTFSGFANSEAEYQIELSLYNTFEEELVALIFDFLESRTSSCTAYKNYPVTENISPT
jgi:hypothetical protein